MFAVLSVLITAACGARKDAGAMQKADSSAAVAAPGTSGTSDAGAVRHVIDSLDARLDEAARSGDTSSLAWFYESDIVRVVPKQPAVHGLQAVDKDWVKWLSQTKVTDYKTKADDVLVSSDMAVETGTFSFVSQPKAGGPGVSGTVRYMSVYRRQADGSWKVAREMEFSDATQ